MLNTFITYQNFAKISKLFSNQTFHLEGNKMAYKCKESCIINLKEYFKAYQCRPSLLSLILGSYTFIDADTTLEKVSQRLCKTECSLLFNTYFITQETLKWRYAHLFSNVSCQAADWMVIVVNVIISMHIKFLRTISWEYHCPKSEKVSKIKNKPRTIIIFELVFIILFRRAGRVMTNVNGVLLLNKGKYFGQ